MNLQCACDSLSNGRTTMEANNRNYNLSQINHASLNSEQSTDITILTAEGDKVTLSSDIQMGASLTTYNSRALANSSYGESRGKLISFHASRQIDIAVDGNLNVDEKKEIKKVLKAIFKMVKDFLSGKDAEIDDYTRKFSDLKTISNVAAEYEIKQSVTLLSGSSAKYAAYEAIPEISEPKTSNSESEDSDDESDPVSRLTDRMLRRVKESDIRPQKFLKHAERMFARRSRAFLRDGLADRGEIGLSKRIVSDFFQKLRKLAANPEGRASHGGCEADTACRGIDAAYSAEASVLQVDMVEKSDSFKLAYEAGD